MSDLRNIKKIDVVVDIERLAQRAESAIKNIQVNYGIEDDLLTPPDPGYYLPGYMLPHVSAKQKVYCKEFNVSQVSVFRPIEDLSDHKEAVYSASGKRLISAADMRAGLLTTTPTVPVRGLQIVRAFHLHHIDQRSRWTRQIKKTLAQKCSNVLSRAFFSSQFVDELIEDLEKLEWTEDLVTGELLNLLDGGEWSSFTVQHFRETSLLIRRGEDERVLDWMRMYDAGNVKPGVDNSREVDDHS